MYSAGQKIWDTEDRTVRIVVNPNAEHLYTDRYKSMPNYECEECRDMLESKQFSVEEVEQYHNGELTIESFDKVQQAVIREVFKKYDDEEEVERVCDLCNRTPDSHGCCGCEAHPDCVTKF